MKHDAFGDWRIQAVATLAQDVPAAYPGGPSHKAGVPVYLVSAAKHDEHNSIGFVTPNHPALALNIALGASKKANHLKQTLAFKDVVTPSGPGKSVAHENLPHLYDFFEQCMISATFSFQALESYCNSVIKSEAKEPIRIKRRKKWVSLLPNEAERKLSTEEKVTIVIPELLNVSTPKGKKHWLGFKTLKATRDATIHLKSSDMYNMEQTDDKSLFFHFLNNDIMLFPTTSFGLIHYFLEAIKIPRWALCFKEKIDI